MSHPQHHKSPKKQTTKRSLHGVKTPTSLPQKIHKWQRNTTVNFERRLHFHVARDTGSPTFIPGQIDARQNPRYLANKSAHFFEDDAIDLHEMEGVRGSRTRTGARGVRLFWRSSEGEKIPLERRPKKRAGPKRANPEQISAFARAHIKPPGDSGDRGGHRTARIEQEHSSMSSQPHC